MRFYQYFKSSSVLFLLYFDKWTPFPIIVQRCFCEIVWPKKVGRFLGKCQRWSPVLIKLQDHVSKTGLRHWLFLRIFPILELSFCRAHVSIFSWSLDVFLFFLGALSGLRQLLATESPLKMMKNAFYFPSKALSFSRYLSFSLDFLVM